MRWPLVGLFGCGGLFFLGSGLLALAYLVWYPGDDPWEWARSALFYGAGAALSGWATWRLIRSRNQD